MSKVRNRKKTISAALVGALALGLISPLGGNLLGAEEKTENIISFEDSGVIYQGEVNLGGTPELPDKLNVVLALADEVDEAEREFEFATPTKEEQQAYGYYILDDDLYLKSFDKDSDITQGVNAGLIEDNGGEGISYRVYGSLNGSDNTWYAANGDGSLLGKIAEVNAIWDTSELDVSTAGEYSLTLSPESMGSYEYDIELPTINIVVKEPEASEDEEEDEEGEEPMADVLDIQPMSGDATINNIVYSINTEAGNYIATVLRHANAVENISGTGYDNSLVTGTITIPSSITVSGTQYQVVAIGSSAFIDAPITSLSLPDTITEIRNMAFSGCSLLASTIDLTRGNITYIGQNAFKDCVLLQGNLNLPTGLTTLGPGAFDNCRNLKGGLVIPAGITKIDSTTFRECHSLNGTLVLHNNIVEIGYEAFKECFLLEGTVELMNPNLKSIGYGAFSECSSLTGTLQLSNSIEEIGSHAFDGCSGFTGPLTLPMGLKKIGAYAFANCSYFSGALVIPDGVTDLPNHVFLRCVRLTSVDLNNVVTIGDSCFNMCTRLEGNLIIPDGVKSIGSSAFARCTGLNGSIYLSNVLEYIGESAFRYNAGMVGTLSIPESVTYVGTFAYAECYGLTKIDHKKRALVDGVLEDLSDIVFNTPDLSSYENTLIREDDYVQLTKSVKWDEDDTTLETAEILLTYEENRASAYDVIFVMSQSNLMIGSLAAVTDGGVTYEYPRSLLMEDIMMDAIDIVLEGNSTSRTKPYTNRVGVIGISGGDSGGVCFTTGNLTANAATAKNVITDNPLVDGGGYTVSYSEALKSAKDMINDSISTGAIPVVIFLSEGHNDDINDSDCLDEAQELREMGAAVQPMLVFESSTSGVDLKELSYDGETVHSAANTSSFEDAMETVIEQMGKIIYLKTVEDSLSTIFDFTTSGGAEIVSISTNGGAYNVAGDKITWELTGSAVEVVHTMKISVDLQVDPNAVISTTGNNLKTNSKLVSTLNYFDEGSDTQPTLTRYIAMYQFADGNGDTLPTAVLNAIRTDANYKSYTGGYKDEVTVTPWSPATTSIEISGDTYVFKGWDETTQTIDGANITFTGTWELQHNAFAAQFTKVDAEDHSTGLDGAQFKLFEHTCENASHNHIVDMEDVVDLSSPGTCWTSVKEADGITDKIFTSDSDGEVNLGGLDTGYYMLVEVKAPAGYEIPIGQWMVDVDSSKDDTPGGGYKLNFVAKTKNIIPNAIVRTSSGSGVSYKVVNTKPMKLPLSGFNGINVYVLGGILIMLLSLGVYLYDQRKKRKSM
ncbi:MAG: leucine-rich repeat protein [Suipraeoptans sp.]